MPVSQAEVLVVVDGKEWIRHLLDPGAYVFGSAPDCEIEITAPHVSRHHARMLVGEDGSLVIEDLGSTNGTLLDGQPIVAPTLVTPDQSIQIGAAQVRFRHCCSPALAEPAVLPDLSVETRYHIGSEIAKGGMGAIHAARQTSIRREVALKVMLGESSMQERLRFIGEAQITGQLEHPNIVPVHELALDEQGQPFYSMKRVNGSTLKEVLTLVAQGDRIAKEKYPLAALLTVFQKVCDAVAFAHSKGVIHRDLKPANIMIGEYGEVLVMDWGLAKVVERSGGVEDGVASDAGGEGETRKTHLIATARDDESEHFATMDGQVMGTPQYMSPEQARGEVATLDRRSDIFSLGAILYELVTLAPAFGGKTILEILSRIEAGDFLAPNLYLRQSGTRPAHLPGPGISKSLEAVILKALALGQDDRYQRVEHLQADLAAYQAGFATSAEDAGVWQLLQLFGRRHRAICTGAAIACLAAAIFGTRAILEGQRAERETARALAERDRAERQTTLAVAESQRAERARDEAVAAQKRAQEAAALALAEGARAEREKVKSTEEGQRAEREAAQAAAEKQRAEREAVQAVTAGNRAEQALSDLKKSAPELLMGAMNGTAHGRFDSALEKVEAALRLDAKLSDVYWTRGTILLVQEKFPEALEALRQGQSGDPTATKYSELLPLVEQLDAATRAKGGFLWAGGYPEIVHLIYDCLVEYDAIGPAWYLASTSLVTSKAKDFNEVSAQLEKQVAKPKVPATSSPAGQNPSYSVYEDLSFYITVMLDGRSFGPLQQLRGIRIDKLQAYSAGISSLEPLRGMRLVALNLGPSVVSNNLAARAMMGVGHVVFGRAGGTPNSVRDLSPLQGMPLKVLVLDENPVEDLRPLRGLPIRVLTLSGSNLSNLAPLAGSSLRQLALRRVRVTDLKPLAGIPLTDLELNEIPVTDFSPLRGMPLRSLDVGNTAFSDGTILAGMPLTRLDAGQTKLTNLATLIGLPLKQLDLTSTPIADFTPLLQIPSLEELSASGEAEALLPLRAHPGLKKIKARFPWAPASPAPKSRPVAEFWADVDAHRKAPGK